jgi:surface protein
MNNMFRQAPLFNQDINGWDVSKVTTTVLMFYQANSFNQDLNSWNVGSLTNPSRMFESCSSFNGNISSWQFTTDPAKSINMSRMFTNATSFNQNISTWNVSRVTNLSDFLSSSKLSRENYDALLLGWSTLDAGETQIPTGLNAHFGSSKYSNTSTVVTARDTELISNKGWTITDGGIDSDFTLPLIASNSLALNNTTISITFSEAVFKTDLGSGTLEISDFLFALSGGTATLSATTPISITSTNNLTFVLGIGLTGTPNGNEILTVTPVLNAIFDASGNVASTTQTNNTAQLHDLSVPVITGPDSTTGSSSSISISENHTSGFSFTANKPVTWTLGNLNDETLFAIDSSGSLTFINAPDYEAPLSSTSSNIYLVEVIATDGSSRVSIQTLTITILDVPPTIFGTFNAINKYYFSGTHTIIAPSTNNSNPITYTSDNTTVATITGTIITFTGVGTANIIATHASDANYESSSVSALLTVVSENVVSKYGGISPTNPNYVDRHGKIGGANAVSKNGALLQVIPPFSGGTFDGFTYSLVTSETGRVWLDRNLGASQVATSSSDALSFGDLYQWGRGTDGHEKRTSTNINMVSTTDTPGHSFFINANSFNWQSPVNTNLWQGVNGTNNPCPNGFRVPTIEELEAERNLWGSQNAAGAIASSLKLPLAGRRHTNGIIYSVGSNGMYRTTTSLILNITSTTAARAGDERIDGFCVRCIKD